MDATLGAEKISRCLAAFRFAAGSPNAELKSAKILPNVKLTGLATLLKDTVAGLLWIGAMDVYLQPHSDDICFSLGALAYRRRQGILVTVCPISGYVPLKRGQARPPADDVTATRKKEDETFCRSCGLEARFMDLACATHLGHKPFDLGKVSWNAERIGPPVIEELRSLVAKRDDRPWLFCPIGIGGHVDHLALRNTILNNYEELSHIFKIGFYEDLHYASNAEARVAGVELFLDALGGHNICRYALPLGRLASTKLKLINIYRSQFLRRPRSLSKFVPSTPLPSEPHEAIWSEEVFDDLQAPPPRSWASLSFGLIAKRFR
jgi:LmbE family N-acetylglucosaminyl deacetylase